MTTPEYTDDLQRPRGAAPSNVLKIAASAAVAVALAIGAYAIGKSNTTASITPAAAGGTQAAAVPNASQVDPRGAGGPPGALGTEVTGTTLTKLAQIATARYPGTVERAFEQSDGSYQVHVIKADGTGEVHVLVSKAFKVTGTETGGPPPGTSQGQSQAPPATQSGTSS